MDVHCMGGHSGQLYSLVSWKGIIAFRSNESGDVISTIIEHTSGKATTH